MSAIATFCLTATPWAAEKASDAGWPVSVGIKEMIVLTYYRSLLEAAQDVMFPKSSEDVSLYEYTRSNAIDATSVEVVSTGRSVKFRVERSAISESIGSGSGPKVHLPVSLVYDGEGIVGASGQGPSEKLFLDVQSASISEISARKRFRYITGPSPSVLSDVFKGNAPSPSEDALRGAVQYDGTAYCGYQAFRVGTDFDSINQVAISSIPLPFNTYNAFAKFDRSGNVQQVISCHPRSGASTCQIGGFVNDWLPYTLTFDSRYTCQITEIIPPILAWLKDRIVAETLAPGN
ncbi:hypothetical protein [Mesorhizobium sp. CO1-1-4]|uniref:hypothetical protein n=1 Tax=Mesorhizobium sp. CO1-1-4 TaxID=2876633 RepID=UPI001CCBFFBF|nr:hypothetical protein [Mesorhizobium sp. CO1-1-4]MBZ9740678.1 hypothetical protein [Mesorhizobium sp. CO1-1-4]